MVLRKRIRKIKQGMKRYNSQLSLLRQDLRACKRKTAEQQKQICEQQKQLAEQQKQTLEYATRLDDYDKKNDEISRKFSTLLQELNKCKTELQYWRSKSPATPPFCAGCGDVVAPHPDELQALVNQGVVPEGVKVDQKSEAKVDRPEIEGEIEVTASTSREESAAFAVSETPTTVGSAPAGVSRKRRSQDGAGASTSGKKPKRFAAAAKLRGKRVKV